MPVFSFGERKNGLLKSSGLSSSHTLSSFCQNANTPSPRFASLITSANGRRPPLAATTGGAPGGRRPDAAALGAVALAGGLDAAALGAAAPALLTLFSVVQPPSAATAAARVKARAGVRWSMGI